MQHLHVLSCVRVPGVRARKRRGGETNVLMSCAILRAEYRKRDKQYVWRLHELVGPTIWSNAVGNMLSFHMGMEECIAKYKLDWNDDADIGGIAPQPGIEILAGAHDGLEEGNEP